MSTPADNVVSFQSAFARMNYATDDVLHAMDSPEGVMVADALGAWLSCEQARGLTELLDPVPLTSRDYLAGRVAGLRLAKLSFERTRAALVAIRAAETRT